LTVVIDGIFVHGIFRHDPLQLYNRIIVRMLQLESTFEQGET